MSWLSELFFGQGIAHSVLMFAIVIALGIVLGKVKVWGILFVGIICSHLGMRVDGHTLHFMKEFGLILFVYSVGLQVGPGFFSSFRKGGLTLNMLAAGIVFLGVVTTYIIHVVTGLPITTMVGILSGAVTNTPGLGAPPSDHLHGVRCRKRGAGPSPFQKRHFLHPHQGRHFRLRCQLGPGALCHGLCRGGFRSHSGGCDLCFPGRKSDRMPKGTGTSL